MAAVTPIEPGWLARTFADYELLPDLLAACIDADPAGPPQFWTGLLSDYNCNIEHMDEESEPPLEDIQAHLIADAWHLVRALQLTGDNGLTPAGQRIAFLASTQLVERSETQLGELYDTLAAQIRTCYLGQDDLNIAALLQRGAGILAGTDHVWAAYCPGLLLVEYMALVQCAVSDPARAEALCDELLQNRDTAMHPYDMPSPDRPPMENMIIHGDAVAAFYFDNTHLLADTCPAIGTARATAMLFTFTGLLREVYPVGPVQCLALDST